jgi:thioredoxin reductase (NADPH)
VIITTGVDYRSLEAPDVDKFTGAGIYYGASTTEAHACRERDVYIVGGGNSAGQSAMYLSNVAKNVFIVIRKKDLSATMSQYLIDQINNTPNIQVVGETIVGQVYGNEKLEEICLENLVTKARRQEKAAALFIFIGAKPVTDWLKLDIIKDEKGYIETGRDLFKYESFKKAWKLQREPYLLETCSPGIFAAGDVRAGAMNRVASAVGEGAMAIKFVHEYLAEN